MSGLRAGAACSCITPALGWHICGYFSDRIAQDIHDDLFAKSIVLENENNCIAIVVCDLIALYKEDIDIAKQRASKLTGIPQENILISCTHTHYGPASVPALGTPRDEAYMEHAMEHVADSVKLAQNRLVEAEVGVATTSCPGECFNRRWLMKDGTVRMNPGYLNPEAVRPVGPTDPEVIVLAVRDTERRPVALLANYALHYVGGPYPFTISADYFGLFDRAMQRIAGQELVAIMANGFCGDIDSCDFSRPQPEMPHLFFQVERVANVLAGLAYAAWQGLRDLDYDRAPVLAAATELITFRGREHTPAQLEQAKQLVQAYSANSVSTQPDAEPDEFRRLIYAREALLLAQEPLERLTPVMGLRIGRLGAVGLPGEIFVEYGLQIKDRSPFVPTMTIELANDYVGYCPTDKALAEGGYETELARSAKAAPGTEKLMVEAALRALNRLAEAWECVELSVI